MNFGDIYYHYKSNCGKYVDLETNKIIMVKNDYGYFFNESNYYCCYKSDVGAYFRPKMKIDCNNFCSENVKKIPSSSFELIIKSQFQTLAYYAANNKKNEKEIKEMKVQLEEALKVNDNLNENDKESEEYWFVVDTVGRISEEFIELGISNVEDYYSDLNEIEYIRDWCIANNVEYEKDTYDLFVEQFKYSSNILEWKKTDNKIDEYIKMMTIDIPRNFEHYIIKYPDFKYLLFEEKIVFKVNSIEDFDLHIINNGNWKKIQRINYELRSIIEDFDSSYLYNDFYLLYNNTEKKYNYYDKNKKNEVFIFRLHEWLGNYELYIKKMIL